MKHGDKTKGKASKASGKKAGAAGKAGKASGSAQAKAKGKSSAAKASPEASKPESDNGRSRPRAAGDTSFSDPVVGAAFKHAVKKYPNAFRKLTD